MLNLSSFFFMPLLLVRDERETERKEEKKKERKERKREEKKSYKEREHTIYTVAYVKLPFIATKLVITSGSINLIGRVFTSAQEVEVE